MQRLAKGPIDVEPTLSHDVVVLPSELDNDNGIYAESVSSLVKQLRRSGIDASYLHDAEHRRWRLRKSADLPTELFIGVAASAVWSIIAAGFRKFLRPGTQVRAIVLRQQQDPNGSTRSTWFSYNGDADGFVQALRDIDPRSPEETADH